MTVWKLLLVSLPLDLLVVSIDIRILISPSLLAFLGIAALTGLVLSAGFLSRDSIFDSFDKLQELQQRSMRLSIKHSRSIFIAVIALVSLEIILHFGSFGLVALVPGAFLAVRASRAIQKSFREQRTRFLAFERDQVLLLAAQNKRLLVISLFPLISARVASLCAAIEVLATSQYLSAWLPYGAVTLILLCTLMPKEEDFIARCGRCSRWTSRALKSKGCCPVCTREEFQVKENIVAAPHQFAEPEKSHAARLKALIQFLTRAIASEKRA